MGLGVMCEDRRCSGYRTVTRRQAAVTVQFDEANPTSDGKFRRDLLRLAALHLDSGALAEMIRSLRGTDDAPSGCSRRALRSHRPDAWTHSRTFPRNVAETTNHILAIGLNKST